MKKLVNSFLEVKFYDDELSKAKRFFIITEEDLLDDEDVQEYNKGVGRAGDLEELAEVYNDYTDILGNGSRCSVEEIITSIYDYNLEELMMKVCNMSTYDIRKHIEAGATLYSVDDYIQHLKDCNCLDLEELGFEDEEEMAEALRDGECSGDIESGIFAEFDYVIEFNL